MRSKTTFIAANPGPPSPPSDGFASADLLRPADQALGQPPFALERLWLRSRHHDRRRKLAIHDPLVVAVHRTFEPRGATL